MMIKSVLILCMIAIAASLYWRPRNHPMAAPVWPSSVNPEVIAPPAPENLAPEEQDDQEPSLQNVESLSLPTKIRAIERAAYSTARAHRHARNIVAKMLSQGSAGEALLAIDLLKHFPDFVLNDGAQIARELCRFQSDEMQFELIRSKLERNQMSIDLSSCNG